jgi:hypothetical protein
MTTITTPITRRVALLLLVGLTAACAGARGAPGDSLVRSELYFGRERPTGGTVSEAEWRAFLAEHVTPRFPAGLTVVDAAGQYRDAAGRIVREESKVVVILHPGTPQTWGAIDEIRTIYKKLFDQESVLLLSSRARAAF